MSEYEIGLVSEATLKNVVEAPLSSSAAIVIYFWLGADFSLVIADFYAFAGNFPFGLSL